ncbi:MAG: HlyD family type I secretion periplasmic adaptor subunit [Novosphingobium sp.]
MNSPGAITPGMLPDLWEDERDDDASLRRIALIATGFLIVLMLLSAFVPIGGAVIGIGQVGLESRVKRIAHPFGGVIAEIMAANGEHVEKGQLLMRLDDKVTGADATYSSLTVEQLLAQRARLEAERLGASSIDFPDELRKANTQSAREAMADETSLFNIRRSEEVQLRSQLRSQIKQLNDRIAGIDAQITALKQQRDLIGPERDGVRELWEQQLVTINRLNQVERTAAEIDGRIASLQSDITRARSQISEVEERTIQMSQTRRVEAGTELARVLTALNEQRVRSVAAGDQSNRSEIRAPYTGTVEKIAFAAIGDVVRPAEPIMEIVPDLDEMVVEASVSPTDIDQVHKGQKARIRFSAFNLSATPQIEGKVTYVATNRSEDAEKRSSYYMVRVAIDRAAIEKEGLDLRSGMPAEVFIETGNRSMLSYLTKPLRDQFARSFRDG